MMIEVYVHGCTAAKTTRNLADAQTGLVLWDQEGGVRTRGGLTASAVPLGLEAVVKVGRRLAEAGLTVDRPLADRWFQRDVGHGSVFRRACRAATSLSERFGSLALPDC